MEVGKVMESEHIPYVFRLISNTDQMFQDSQITSAYQ